MTYSRKIEREREIHGIIQRVILEKIRERKIHGKIQGEEQRVIKIQRFTEKFGESERE